MCYNNGRDKGERTCNSRQAPGPKKKGCYIMTKLVKTTIKTIRFEHGDFWVDFIDYGEKIQAWLCRKGCVRATYIRDNEICKGIFLPFDEFVDTVEMFIEMNEDAYDEDYYGD